MKMSYLRYRKGTKVCREGKDPSSGRVGRGTEIRDAATRTCEGRRRAFQANECLSLSYEVRKRRNVHATEVLLQGWNWKGSV